MNPHVLGWRSRVWRVAAVVLLLLTVAANGVHQSHTKAIRNPNDFVTLYAGSICMTHGCNPYSVRQLDSVLVARRGTEVQQAWFDQLPIYPPTTLFVLLPFSVLSYRAATIVWYSLSLGIYIFSLCWVCFRSPFLKEVSLLGRGSFAVLGLYFPKMLQCLGFGNPSVLVTGLLLFASFDGYERRRLLHIVMAIVACFLKPPLAIIVGPVLLLRETRSQREVWRLAGGSAAAFLLIGLCSYFPSGMTHWPQDLQANLALGEQGGMSPSNRVSPSNVLLNAANLTGYFTANHAVIQVITALVLVPLFVCFAVLLYRASARLPRRDDVYLTAVAAAAALTLLPVYHRFCDIGILLLVAPWVFRELDRPRRGWLVIATVPILAALYFSWERRIQLDRLHGSKLKLVEFLYYRGDAILVLLLACALLSALVVSVRRAEVAA